MMSFQKLTTLAALVLLYASNAALAAPMPQLPLPSLSSVTQPLALVDDVAGTAGGLVGTAENLVGGPVSGITPVLSSVPIAGNVVRDDGLPPLDSVVQSSVPPVGGVDTKTVVDTVIDEVVPSAAKGIVRRDTLPISLPTLPVVGDLNNIGSTNLPVADSILPPVVSTVENII